MQASVQVAHSMVLQEVVPAVKYHGFAYRQLPWWRINTFVEEVEVDSDAEILLNRLNWMKWRSSRCL